MYILYGKTSRFPRKANARGFIILLAVTYYNIHYINSPYIRLTVTTWQSHYKPQEFFN